MRLIVLMLLFPAVLAAQAAAVDTTIQPGHVDFSRYDQPSACWHAVRLASAVADRASVDSARYAPDGDSLPANVVAIARQCGARFTVGAVAPRELTSLAALSIAMGNDAQAAAAATRLGAVTRDPEERGWALLSVVQAYVDARPSRGASADQLIARLDSIGKPADAARGNAHLLLRTDAIARFDRPRWERESQAILALAQQMGPDAQGDLTQGAGGVIMDLLFAEVYQATPAAAIARTMQLVAASGFKYPSDSATVLLTLSSLLEPIGKPAPPVVTTHWYGPHGTNWWVPNKVSVAFATSGGIVDFRLQGVIRRLHAKYGDSLDIALLTRTAGFIGDSPPLEPAAEADSLRVLYQDVQHLPVTVAVGETPFHRLPAPDGRRIDDPPPPGVDAFAFPMLLVDQHGVVRQCAMISEAVLDAFVEDALHAKR
jgi:hypothetical protein